MSIMFVTSLYIITTLPWLLVSSTTIPDESQSSMTCNNCCQGPSGIPGVPGAAGIPGSPGAAGIQGAPGGFGPQGPLGQKGERGEPGLSVKGSKGDAGIVGPSGPSGQIGLRGPPGKVGPMGIRGPRGENGLDGIGNQGVKGEKGEAASTAFAGFTVAKTNSQSGPGIVTFDTVITDVNGDYNTNTNKFTCSVPGYYVFTFNVGTNSNNNPYVKLLHNGNDIVHTYTYPSSTAYHHSGSNSVLLLMAAGDQVWLHNNHNKQIYSASHNKMTTFTGVLLHATI